MLSFQKNDLTELTKGLRWIALSAIFVLFILLLAKNPYSERTLIPNLEPFPDTFHYLVPPKCFLAGEGWKLCRNSLPGTSVAVPPLYSVVLMPIFLLRSDPSLFYGVNVLLALASLFLIFLITKRVSTVWYIPALISFLFVTSYHVYWIPSLAMAENLLIPLFLAFVLLLTYPVTRARIIAASCIAASLYGTKYAAVPVFGIASATYMGKIFFEQRSRYTLVISNLALFTLPATGLYLLFGGMATATSILSVLLAKSSSSGSVTENTGNEWHTVTYVAKHLPIYWRMLQGHPATFLWDTRPLLLPLLAVLGWVGLGLGILKNKLRTPSIFLITTIIAQIVTLSFFYTTDARYIVIAIPSLLIGVGIALDSIVRLSDKNLWRNVCFLVIIACSIGMFATQVGRLKSQISLNLKYSETPWWYISVKNAAIFFEKEQLPERPIVITAVSPFLFDLYGVNNIEIQPLSPELDFRGHKSEVWGSYDYSDLIVLYRRLVNEGRAVYLMSYGIGNEEDRRYWLDQLLSQFDAELKQEGCYSLCNIYKLTLPNAIDAMEPTEK